MKDASAIVGIGETRFAKRLEESETELALQAILAALDDAGIDAGEVDGLASYTMESSDEVEIARNLGYRDVHFFSRQFTSVMGRPPGQFRSRERPQ